MEQFSTHLTYSEGFGWSATVRFSDYELGRAEHWCAPRGSKDVQALANELCSITCAFADWGTSGIPAATEGWTWVVDVESASATAAGTAGSLKQEQ